MLLWEPDTIRVIRELVAERKEGIQAWYSIDTGPSVFINTFKENSKTIAEDLKEIGFEDVVISGIGGRPFSADNHLF
jgi:mevalonate pyrophosphate decarboxylase